MIEIWTEFDRFKQTNQRLSNQVRTITKMVGFRALKYWKSTNIYRGTHSHTVTASLNTGKPKTSNQILHDNDGHYKHGR